MNPYAKGLGSEVYAQSAPTSAGKVATHFNSPYMRAITQNLMTAIYGSPQDELTRQRIEQSKLAMQQTQQEMDLAASQGEARGQLGNLLADPNSYDETGNLLPQARAAASQLNLQSGGKAGDFFIQTGQFGRDMAIQDDAQTHSTSERVAGQEYRTGERVAGQEYKTGERIATQGFTTERDQYLFAQALARDLAQHNQALAIDNNQNAWQAGQNELDRELESTRAMLGDIFGDVTSADAVTAIAGQYGQELEPGTAEILSSVTPHPTSSSKPQSLVPFNRMYDFAYAQGVGNDLSESEQVAELSRVATQALELIAADPRISEVEAVQRVIQMDNAPQDNDSGIWKIERKN